MAVERTERRGTEGRFYWLCRCDCGTEREVFSTKLLKGRSKSCGCVFVERGRMLREAKALRAAERERIRQERLERHLKAKQAGIERSRKAAERSVWREYRRGAVRRGLSFGLTREQARALWTSPCFYCRRPPANVSTTSKAVFVYSGIDRVDNSRGYDADNVVSCCCVCNRGKREMSGAEWERWLDETARARVNECA